MGQWDLVDDGCIYLIVYRDLYFSVSYPKLDLPLRSASSWCAYVPQYLHKSTNACD